MSAPCPKFGFIVSAKSGQDASALGRVLAEYFAATGLEVNATVDDASRIVISREGSQATETDRQLVIGFLNGEPYAGTATVSDLIDFNY